MISIVYFDLGGVVFTDFFSGGIKEFEKALRLPRKRIASAWLHTDTVEFSLGKVSDEERCRRFVREVGLPGNKIPLCIDAYYKGYKPIEETISFVQELKKTIPHIRLGILSDQATGVARYLRKHYSSVLGLFDSSLTLISAEVGMSKKSEDLKIYNEAIKRSRVEPHKILFVDNSLENIKKAQKLGMEGFFFDIERINVSVLLNDLESAIRQ